MKKVIIGIVAVTLIVFIALFLSTGGVRTDVVLRNYKVSEDGKTMTITVDVLSSAGYIRKMKQTDNYMEPDLINLTFYSTFGINSKLGAKDTFTLELDSNVDEIYFNKGNKGYNKVLKKDKETGEWNIVKNVDSNRYEDYKKVSTLHSKTASTTMLVRYDGNLYGRSFSIIDYAPNPNGAIGVIDKLIDSEYVPKYNGETNTEELLNAKVDSKGETTLVLNYNNNYVLYEIIEE